MRGISAARRREEVRALATIVAATVLPLVLAFILVAADMRSDLSDLTPSETLPDGGPALIGWGALLIPWGQPRRHVRMLGYMMTGNSPARDGAPVETFVLLPEAGQFLHPAHRIPDQMVEVWPSRPALFKFRSLTWATGVLIRRKGSRNPEQPLFVMTSADVRQAPQSDITLWFKP
jgi:hypothetical protein